MFINISGSEVEKKDLNMGIHNVVFSPVLVQPVLPPDPLKDLDLASDKPVAGLVDHLEKNH